MTERSSELPGYTVIPEPDLMFAGGALDKHPLRGLISAGPYGLKYGALAAAICHSMQDAAETPDGVNLTELRREQGMKAFLEARDAPYR